MEKGKKAYKNVLYVFADQLSLLALNMYDSINLVNTPNMDYLAGHGVKFVNSYCTTPQCSPSRSSLLTGLYPHKTRIMSNVEPNGYIENFDPGIINIGSYLKKYGYRTGYFGKWHLGTPISEFGFDSSTRYDRGNADEDPQITEDTLCFLDEAGDETWIAMVSYENPHDIYKINLVSSDKVMQDTSGIKLPLSFYNDDLKGKPSAQSVFRDVDQGRITGQYGENEWKCYIAYYYELIEALDIEIGKLIHRLKEKDLLENTIIIFSSDHGDLMGAHRCPFKGPMMYDELVKIPFIISCPGLIPQNETRSQFTVNVDVFPTICDFLGLEAPKGLHGDSIKACILDSNVPGKEYIFLEYYSKQNWFNPIRSVVSRQYKYNYYISGEEELYDTQNDKGEVVNLAGEAFHLSQKQYMKGLLLDRIERLQDPFFTLKQTKLDNAIL